MRCLIYQDQSVPDASLFPVAGEPLLVRQLEWLRSSGVEQVAVEIPRGSLGQEILTLLAERPALFADVVPVLLPRPTERHEVARRAGFDADEPIVMMAANVLADFDLTAFGPDRAPTRVLLRAPETCSFLLPTTLEWSPPRPAVRTHVCSGEGWGTELVTKEDAIDLSAALLTGQAHGRHLIIHGAERAPGVWLARGARIAPGAEVTAPVLLGPDAFVDRGAKVGPGAIIGAGAAVLDGVEVRHSVVDANVVLRQPGAHIERSLVTTHAIIDARTNARSPRAEAPFTAGPRTSLMARLVALVLIPFAIAWTPFSGGRAGALIAALFEVLQGHRHLIGAHHPLHLNTPTGPLAAIDVERALVADPLDSAARLRARLWYQSAKRPSLDARLLLRALIS